MITGELKDKVDRMVSILRSVRATAAPVHEVA